jgi:hypothetical protein
VDDVVMCCDDGVRVRVESPIDVRMTFVAGDFHLAVVDASSADVACAVVG